MSDFHQKKFQGTVYAFDHLAPMQVQVALNADKSLVVAMTVTFGCHCFTEVYRETTHTPDYRYTYKGETRAFDLERYECSLQLRQVIAQLQSGKIYNADRSYTYAARITIESLAGPQVYSVFFNLEKDKDSSVPALRMFVKSAYFKPLVTKAGAQGWRFASLAGQVAGVFDAPKPKPKPAKKPKPEKKKAP